MADAAPRNEARYPLVNANTHEVARLGLLQELSDPITVRWLEELGVGPGWRCAELGAGAGSIAAWMADQVGPAGAVTAVDRDTTQLSALAERQNVTVLEADLCALELPAESYDLVHSRAVLMHLDCPDSVVDSAVRALRPGGQVLFEESDGAPALAVTDPPEPFALVILPIARRWTWARGLATLLESLGMIEGGDDVREDPLVGGTPVAAFWQHTLESVAGLLERGAPDDSYGAPDVSGMDRSAIAAMSALLDDPNFRIPLSARHRVTGRKPA